MGNETRSTLLTSTQHERGGSKWNSESKGSRLERGELYVFSGLILVEMGKPQETLRSLE